MFDAVLVANRGEIAVRIIRTLRSMGVRSVAVYSDADGDARHVADADEAIHLGPTPARESYLDVERVVAAALRAGANALHPGYGFLAEHAGLARACADAGLVFVGPSPAAMEAMGDKVRAKQLVAAAGVPVVPGRLTPDPSDEQLTAAAAEVGYPVLLKPSAGGGGKGMRLVGEPGGLQRAIEAARREARGSFGDDTLLVERYLERPRHIEVQVVADHHGNVVHLGERECSLQRRHQKIVEEAPSPLLGEAQRAAMCASAVAVTRACSYTNAGTVEFIVSAERPEEFFFMEMNTRLQVEHPVTELIYGLDLVELQLRIAAGEHLPWRQEELVATGHAVEARLCAEDPERQFLPTGGRVLALREPDLPSVRVDSGLRQGLVVGSAYDPMLAKVIAWGRDRKEARARLDQALASTVILGVTNNVGFLRSLLADPDVASGVLDTELVERRVDQWLESSVPDHVLAAAALARLFGERQDEMRSDPWELRDGWRIGEPAWSSWRLTVNGHGPVEVRARGRAAGAEVSIAEADPVAAAVRFDGGDVVITLEGRRAPLVWCRDGETSWFGMEGRAYAVRADDPWTVAVSGGGAGAGGPLLSPMPGVVVSVNVAKGDRVVAGQPVATVEAMKMEHTVTAAGEGVVIDVHVAPGQQVAMNQPLATIAPGPA